MIAQLDLFAVLERPSAPPPLVAHAAPLVARAAPVAGTRPGKNDERPHWITNAYQHDGEILAYKDTPPPFELTVRGVRTVIAFGFGFSTHAIDAPGSLYWSDTGFRSFTCSNSRSPDEIRREIEAYIDAPTRDHMGLDGKLSPWWPLHISMKVTDARWSLSTTVERFADKGEDEAAHVVATAHAHARQLLDEVLAAGFDPWAICPDLPRQSTLI